MLTIDPSKRASIEEIICHRWMTIAGDDPEFEKLISESMRPSSPVPLEPLNELILQHMSRLEFDRQQTVRVILSSFALVLYDFIVLYRNYQVILFYQSFNHHLFRTLGTCHVQT